MTTPISARISLPNVQGLFRNTITSSDRHVISQFLLDAETELRACQAEINRLKASIHLIENKKSNLKDCMAKCRSLLSLFHRLPTETLVDIFAYACEDSALEPSAPPTVILLSAVCGRWRNIVVTTPRLWSSFQIDFGPWKEKAAHLAKSTLTFMERSKTCPLDITITFPADKDTNNGWMVSVIDTLSGGCSRWQNVSLSLPQHITLPNDLFRHVRGQALPLLRHLRIINRETGGICTRLQLLSGVLGGCISLRFLEVEGKADCISDLGLPLHHITALSFVRVWSSHCLAFLRLLPQLEELHLNFVAQMDLPSEHMVSNTVKTLILSSKCQTDHDTLMKHITFPELRALTFSLWRPSRPSARASWSVWDATSTMDFLSRSGCTLTSLSLKLIPIADQQTIALLQSTPHLTSLEIEEFESRRLPNADSLSNRNRIVTDTFLQHFMVNQEMYRIGQPATSFLPLLTDLTLKIHAERLPDQGLFAAISSRWIPDPARARDIGVECLRSVKVTVMGGEDSEGSMLESLRCFRDAGLRLNIDRVAASS